MFIVISIVHVTRQLHVYYSENKGVEYNDMYSWHVVVE